MIGFLLFSFRFKLAIMEFRVKLSPLALFTEASSVFGHIQHRGFRYGSSFVLELDFSVEFSKSLPQSNPWRD
jgi:hypothetical protein